MSARKSTHVLNLRGDQSRRPERPAPHISPRPGIGADILARPRAVAKRAIAERPRVVTPHRRLNAVLELFQYPLVSIAALAAAYSSAAGQWFVLAYGLFAIFGRRPSRLTFGIALFLLVTIPFFQVIGQSGIAENAAIYTYDLLVISTIQTLLELQKTNISTKS